jgi:hexosaminidase
VNYAKARYIDIIPEIDMPGHTNAALASYAKLNCNGVAPAPRTDTAVGYSSLCVPSAGIPQATMDFMHAIVDQLTALSPGPFMHVGGDESAATPVNDYKNFVTQVQARVQANGKRMYGWEENAKIDAYSSTSVAQHWNKGSGNAADAVKKGAKVVMSPCEHAYFDMTYGRDTPPGLGLTWCQTINVQQSYEWNPGTLIAGVGESDVLGVEGCLWGETILTTMDIDLLMWPRMCSLQEVGWSATTGRSWAEYRMRLASHGPRLANMGVHFFKSAEVPWAAAIERA